MKTCVCKLLFISIVLYLALVSITFSQPKTITILHTNDMHASFIPHEAFWLRESPKPMIGGFNELNFEVDSIRHVIPVTLLLDAGDVMTGNPITEYSYRGAEGGALLEMMNLIGYEAWTVGNHDFDISPANLKKLTAIAAFPTVSANIVDTTGNFPVHNKEYIIIEKGGLKIGIFGLMLSGFYNEVSRKSTEGIKILSPVETAKRIIAQLNPKTDLLIAVTHQGVDDDSILAMNVQGLDVIVGGHSHTRLKKPRVVNGVIIVQTGSNCEYLGELTLAVDKHKINSFDGKLLSLWYHPDRPQTKLSRFIDSMKTAIDNDYAEVIGTLKTDWNRGHGGESGVGNFLADAQREAAGADIGFMNSAGIRKDVSAGPVTKRDLFEVLPFRNILVKFQLTGKQVKQLVEYYINEHSGVQTSGLRVEWKRERGKDIEFTKFFVNGKPLNENKNYTGAASDYMMGEAERYLGIAKPKLTYLDQTVFAAVEKKIRTLKEVNAVIEHRIQKVNEGAGHE